jgi:hypothetical protein
VRLAAVVIYWRQTIFRKKGVAMSLTKSWITVDEAVERFGLDRSKILGWVEDGLVRTEESGNAVVRVNLDDLELKVQEMTGI